MPTPTYDPETTIAELRLAIDTREASFRVLNDSMVRAAAQAEGEHFPDPRLREAAGLGAIVAAASVAAIAKPGGETMVLNCTALFGLALVDSARDELGTAKRCGQPVSTGSVCERPSGYPPARTRPPTDSKGA